MKCNLSFFFLSGPYSKSQRFFSIFFSRILGFIFRSIIHFEVTFCIQCKIWIITILICTFVIIDVVEHIFICLNIIYVVLVCLLFSCELLGQVLCWGLLSLDMQFVKVETETWPHTAHRATDTARGPLFLIHPLGAPFFPAHKGVAFVHLSSVFQVFFIFYRSSLYFCPSPL